MNDFILDRECSGPIRLGVPSDIVHSVPRDVCPLLLNDDVAILLPIEWLPWWSKPFFERQLSVAKYGPVLYVDWDAWRQFDHRITPPTSPLGDLPTVWVSEVPSGMEAVADHSVSEIAALFGCEATPMALLGDEDAVEDYYLLDVCLRDSDQSPFDPVSEWRKRLASTDLAAENLRSFVLVDPTEAEVDRVWDLYRASMSELSLAHPVSAELDRATFESLAYGVNGCIAVSVVDGIAVAGAIIGIGTAAFDWLDERWFRSLPASSDARDLVLWPGIFTHRSYRNQGLMLELLDLVSHLILETRSELRIVFPCDNRSNEYTPYIAQSAVNARYPSISGIVNHVVGYVFRGYRIQ